MYLVLRVTLVCLWSKLVSCGLQDPIVDTVINFNSKVKYFADDSVISECMPEHNYYDVGANESVLIKLHHNARNIQQVVCDAPRQEITFINETNGSPNELNYYIPSIGRENLLAYCLITQNLNTTGYVYSWCQVRIRVKGAKIESNSSFFTYTTKDIHAYLTVDPKVPNTMRDVIYFKNNTLSVKCIEPDDINYTHVLIGKDNGGKSTKLIDGNFHGLYHNMDESFNNMELVCVVTHKRTNNTLKAGITLRYRIYVEGLSIVWISVIAVVALVVIVTVGVISARLYSKYKDKKRSRVQSSNDQTNNENVENHYDFIYDNVYEDRMRMERAAREAQERREAEQLRPPTPPPINTIPIPVPVQLEVQPNKLRRYSMLTPASDMYLLQIDSEGYQIPEEVQMRGIQLDMNNTKRS